MYIYIYIYIGVRRAHRLRAVRTCVRAYARTHVDTYTRTRVCLQRTRVFKHLLLKSHGFSRAVDLQKMDIVPSGCFFGLHAAVRCPVVRSLCLEHAGV